MDNRIKSLKEELLPDCIAVSKYQIYSRMLRTEELVEGRFGGRENRYNARRKTVKMLKISCLSRLK